MPNKLYVVNGSHPCAAVRRAMDLKGIDYKIVEFPPPFHVPLQRLRFGQRTVPGLKLESGEKLSGSSAIMRRLDELAPTPAMFGDARVQEAEAWGESVLQPIARRLLWRGFALNHGAMVGYQAGGKLPALPRPVVLALAPLITRIEARLNEVSDDAVRADLHALGDHLDKVDAWIASGVLGGDPPNAADLQIAAPVPRSPRRGARGDFPGGVAPRELRQHRRQPRRLILGLSSVGFRARADRCGRDADGRAPGRPRGRLQGRMPWLARRLLTARGRADRPARCARCRRPRPADRRTGLVLRGAVRTPRRCGWPFNPCGR